MVVVMAGPDLAGEEPTIVGTAASETIRGTAGDDAIRASGHLFGGLATIR
jgi:hypothetical protein